MPFNGWLRHQSGANNVGRVSDRDLQSLAEYRIATAYWANPLLDLIDVFKGAKLSAIFTHPHQFRVWIALTIGHWLIACATQKAWAFTFALAKW